ncbi:alpha/beta hydrolase [Gammaproteobacteria bacterium]|nr:alpha/beta hydrolase [Gammaproteobacteria bacterium]
MHNPQIYLHNFDSIDLEKKSILFIPGAGMDHRFVRALKLPSEEYNQPLVIDLPGHGKTQGFSSNNIQFYSEFLIDALEEFHLKNLVLCGHSMGGLIALDMLISHGFSAKSLLLLNSIYPIKVSSALIEKAKAGNGHAADFIIKFGLYKKLIGMKNIFPQEEALVMLNDLEACNNFELNLRDLKNLELPIALVLGAKDKLVDLKEVDNFAKHSSCVIHSINEVGHFPFFENPSELSNVITSIT